MRYATKIQNVEIGPLRLTLETLDDLDKSIDVLWQEMEKQNREEEAMELAPYFGVIWPSARALAGHLARMGGWLSGKTLLEVGCGLALPSFVAAKLGARVTSTDFHPEVEGFFRRNCERNGLEIRFETLNWRLASKPLGTFDFVVGSDILYESHHPDDVARILSSHCHRESHLLVADPGRAYLQQFSDAIQKQGFRTDTFVRDGVFILSSQKL